MLNVELWKKQKQKLNLTFDKIAEMADVSRRTICSIFSGEIENPRLDTVQAIERALGLAPQWSDEDLKEGVLPNAPIPLSEKEKYWIDTLTRAHEVLGENYVNALLQAVEVSIAQKS